MIRKSLIVIVALVGIFLLFEIVTFPRVGRLADENPSTTAFMERRRDELRTAGKNAELSHTWVSYDRISPHLRSAVIVSEDSRFFEHGGVDTEELEKILREAWKEKELGRGGSTITQQLAKNLYLSPSRNPLRKIKEILIAKRIEQILDKRRILELYLNVVEFGERVYGAEAAARHYFGKSASGLTASEAALLAGSLPNPRKMNPGDPGPYLRSRRDIIVSRMRRWGYMAEEAIAREPSREPASQEELSEPTDPLLDEEAERAPESEEVPEEPFPLEPPTEDQPPELDPPSDPEPVPDPEA